MQTYGIEFYDLFSAAGIADQSDWTGYIDEVLAPVFDVLDTDGFAYEAQQMDYDYYQIVKDRRYTPMAIYADIDSNVQPFGTSGWRVYGGTIPTMKVRRNISRADYRKMVEASKVLAGGDVSNYALDQLFEVGGGMLTSHNNSLTYQRHQMVSTGQLHLTDKNNPYGIIDHKFYANIPKDNINNLSGANLIWTDATRGTEGPGDPIKVMQDTVRKMQREKGIRNIVIEVDYDTAQDLVNHSKVLAALAARLFPLAQGSIASANVALLTWEDNLATLGTIIGATFKIVDSWVTVERNDGSGGLVEDDMKAFAENVLVFRPSGSVGTIKNVVPYRMAGPVPNGTYAPIFGGRGQVIHEVKPLQHVEYIESELTALCVPNIPQLMYYVNLTGTASIAGVAAPLQTRVGGVASVSGASADTESGVEPASSKRSYTKKDKVETVSVDEPAEE